MPDHLLFQHPARELPARSWIQDPVFPLVLELKFFAGQLDILLHGLVHGFGDSFHVARKDAVADTGFEHESHSHGKFCARTVASAVAKTWSERYSLLYVAARSRSS
jgi:hypothetical protein